jgi:hypothetical protein
VSLGFQPINQAIKLDAISSKCFAPDDPNINPHTNKALKKMANEQAKKMIVDEQTKKRKSDVIKSWRKKDNKASSS